MILESREVTKKYGSKTAVNQVSLQLEPGLVYAMLGPNGSGKTTWMKMVVYMRRTTWAASSSTIQRFGLSGSLM